MFRPRKRSFKPKSVIIVLLSVLPVNTVGKGISVVKNDTCDPFSFPVQKSEKPLTIGKIILNEGF